MLPWQPSVDSFLWAIDIFVHPSRREPFGLAIVEAMAARLPVIASRAGGACETVDDGVTGILVAPDDSAELADALIRLAQNADERRAFGDAVGRVSPNISRLRRRGGRSRRRCATLSAAQVSFRRSGVGSVRR